MEFGHCRLPRAIFTALGAGGGGSEAMRELAAAELSKHLLLLAGVRRAAPDGEQRRQAVAGYDLLAEARRADRAAADVVIGYPAVGAWAHQTLSAYRNGRPAEGAGSAGLLSVGVAAAIRARLSTRIEVPAVDGTVVLPSLGIARVPGSIALVRVEKGRASVGPVEIPADPYRNADGWRGLHRVRAGGFDVLIDDLHPFRLPGLTDLAPRLAGWDTALAQAWELLSSHHPGIAAEVAAGIRMVVPRAAPASGSVSTSSPQSFGAVGMSLPPDPVIGAETLAHETQHLKLGAIQQIVKLAQPDDGQRYYAPWRNDPRPLGGLLQGTYAYLGVTGFWRHQRHIPGNSRNADAQYIRWREATALGIETIRSTGRLTTEGSAFIDEMAGTIAAWRAEPVPAHADAEARQAARAHQARYLAAHGFIP
jgi:HEXXH motif-containing protein